MGEPDNVILLIAAIERDMVTLMEAARFFGLLRCT